MNPMLQAAVIFAATFALDFVWTKYIARVGDKKPHAAAFWSMSMIPLGAVNVLGYTTHWWLVFPAMLGAYLSTWWAVQRDVPKPSTVRDIVEKWAPHDESQCWEPCGQLGKSMEHARVAPESDAPPRRRACSHENCHVVAEDWPIVRWSCGSIEG